MQSESIQIVLFSPKTDYVKRLQDWHLELSIAAEALDEFRRLVRDADNSDSSFEHLLMVVSDRIIHLVEDCPLPDVALVDEVISHE